MRTLPILLPMAALMLAGCASAGTAPGTPPSPADVARLESHVAHDPRDVDAEIRLAAAYRQLHRGHDAQVLLERALKQRPNDVQATLLLAVTREEGNDFSGARQLYQRLLSERATSRLRAQVEARLVLLRRKEVLASVRQAMAHEVELRNTPPTPHTLAIFPLTISSPDTSMQPLGRALTAMLETSLSQTHRLKVLDRLSVQLLADEIKLDQSGAVDPRTAARGGRLLGAEHVVAGSMVSDSGEVHLQAAVVAMSPPAAGSSSAPETPSPGDVTAKVTASDPLSHLFDLEDRVALDVYADLGVQLTPAERQAVLSQRTTSVQALLAYGRGLEAEDAGNYAAATRYFRDAMRLDPHFAPARRQYRTVHTVASTGDVTAGQLAVQATRPNPPEGISATLPQPPSVPMQRNPVTESLGTEGSPSATVIDITIPRPGGGG